MKQYPAILSSLYSQAHCILPSKLREIEAFVLARCDGANGGGIEHKQPEPYCLDLGGEPVAMDKISSGSSNSQFVAVMPLFGTMFQHGGMSMAASGGTSTEEFGQQFARMDNNPAVRTIIIEAHTPGGQIWGTSELSDQIFEARQRGRTRTVTAANSQMASAGVWVGTATDQTFVTPGGEIGSIGVVRLHEDVSGAEDQAGVKTTLVAVPAGKVEGHPFGPLEDATIEKWQEQIAVSYGKFVDAVARNVGVSAGRVKSDFGQGGMMRAEDAVAAGLANAVMTKADVLAQEVDRLRAANKGQSRKNANRLALAEAV